MKVSQKRAEVIEKIRRAFAGVRLEYGIGLREEDGIDDYEDQSVCAQYRAEDEKEDWQKITPEKLARYHAALSYFDPKGMRFHLPAFLIAELERTMMFMCTEFHLIELDDVKRGKFALFSSAQHEAVEACLREMLDDPNFKFAHADIAKAIEDYWGVK